MNSDIQLSDFSTAPLYNIKAVVQATGISPSTLRAWERRYQMCRPQRSASGYRLYSDQDIAIILWLKTQVDAGMSISQAVAWLESIVDDARGHAAARLPVGASYAPSEAKASPMQRQSIRALSTLQLELLDALLRFDDAAADQTVSEAFSLYSIEQVGEQLFAPVLVEIGHRWHRNELNIAVEHYATNYVIQRLHALLRTVPNSVRGELVWIGCAPREQHQVGALLLAVYARRAGYRVQYFGQDLPLADLFTEIKRQEPGVVIFSASTLDAVAELEQLIAYLPTFDGPKPLFGYGGQAFNRNPELRDRMAGAFLGESAVEGVNTMERLLRAHNGRQNGDR